MGINAFPGDVKSVYQATAPTNPRVGDIWVDSSSDIASVDLIPSKITGHNLLQRSKLMWQMCSWASMQQMQPIVRFSTRSV